MFIVIEGIDLIGKTAQYDLLVQHLRGRGLDVASFSLPAYHSPTGEAIREHLRGNVALTVQDDTLGLPSISEHDPLVFQSLQLVDKYAVAADVKLALEACQTVVCCRWWQSSYAYGVEDGFDGNWVRRTCSCLPRADVNVLLDLDPRRARRRSGESPDRLEADLARQERIRQGYLELWRVWRRGYDDDCGLWAVVDAEGSADVVHGRILAVLRAAGIAAAGRSSGRGV